ncbi:cellulose synthase subunit BcsC-related outer membrane protein [Salinimonas lutimaris]|uniref:cellulose synthase subunit BcsC-related outer membrane protein n=1 Tax=Salinimonas lutimaris TaxID=914153 RepID=UPI0010C0EEED|nr:cellulose synthase subunit BcsC-related outer membrane protein [Salinimonas lutimaris]
MAKHGVSYLSGCVLASLMTGSACAQVTQYSVLPGESLLQAADTPDTTGLWYHIEQRQVSLANQTYQRLQQEYPYWQPDQNLQEALSRLNQPAEAAPPASATARPPEAASDVFSQLAALPATDWTLIDSSTLAEAVRQAQQSGKSEQHLLLGWIYHQRGAFETALSLFEQARQTGAQKSAQTGIDSAIDGLTNQALKRPDIAELKALSQRFPDAGIPVKAAGQGWSLYDNQHYASALALFQFADDVQGQVLSLDKQGKASQAARLACDTAASSPVQPMLAKRCARALAQQQLSAYKDKQFTSSISAAKKLQDLRGLTRDEQTLLAWTYFQAGDSANAIPLFNTLLDASPEQQDFAQALLTLTTARAQQQQLAQRHPAVARLLSQQQGQTAWQRKQFDLAWHQQAEQAEIYPSRRLYAYTGINGRQRSGDDGLGNLDVAGGYIGLGGIYQQWRWDLHMDYEQLYSGAVPASRWFGDGIVDDMFGGITGFEDTGIRGRVQTQQQDYTLYAEVGYSLLNQPVSAPVSGQLGGSWSFNDATLSAMAYRQRVTDSLLSMGSTYFEDSSEAWGAVIKTGLRGLYAQSLASQRAVSVSWVLGRYTGQQVKDNDHVGIRLDASQDFASAFNVALDYFRVGPYVSWQGFSHNLSGFTRGHGGYFSPSGLTSLGMYGELLSAEARQWQVRSSVNLGYSWIKQDRYSRFALTGRGEQVPAESDAGIGADLMIEGQYLIDDHWLVAGFVQQSFAVEYRATMAGIELRWFAGKHTGVTSNTLILRDPELSGLAL